MGAWGVKGIESDEGLETLETLVELAGDRPEVSSNEFVDHLLAEEYLGEDLEEDEFLFDVVTLATADLLRASAETGAVTEHTAIRLVPEKRAVEELLARVSALQAAEAPDREIKELWFESDSAEEWRAYLDTTAVALASLLDELVIR